MLPQSDEFKTEQVSYQTQAIINNARIGEALGFLTENTLQQKNLMMIFPYGIFNLSKLLVDLKHNKLIAPYGQFNHNYLTSSDKLIFSDDTDLASTTYINITHQSLTSLQNPIFFSQNLAKSFAHHWQEMKKSGDYGPDGLYYGKRGYSKAMLLSLQSLANKNQLQKNWFLADISLQDTLDNGPLLRAWVIGLEPRINAVQAYALGFSQSRITSTNQDIAIVSGAIASTFKKIMLNQFSTKEKVVNDLLVTIIDKTNGRSPSIQYIQLGELLAAKKINPILVYNEIHGFRYNEFLTLLVYSFLYFNDYKTALYYIVHTPGDNDSVAFVLGAFFAAYSHRALDPRLLNHIESQSWS